MAHRHQGVSREHDEHQRDELLLDRYSEVLSHPGFSQSLPQPWTLSFTEGSRSQDSLQSLAGPGAVGLPGPQLHCSMVATVALIPTGM